MKAVYLLIFTVVLLIFWPLFVGKVPLPAGLVLQFPPWEEVRSADYPHPDQHAELGDLVTQFYLWRKYAADCLHRGVLPLWNPHVLLGVPFLAEPQTALFYPPNWIYHFLPLETAWGLNFALRQLMAAVFTAMCARSFGASPAGATVAAIVFALCGWVTAFQGRPQLDTMLWLPLIVFAVDRLHRQQSVQSLALTMLAFALPVLAGHVECALHATVFGAAFAIFRMLWPATLSLQDTKSFHRKRFLLLFVAAGAGAVMLAAVQILPTLEWLGQLQRSLRDYWGSRPTHEVLAFFSRDIAHNPNAANIAIPEGAGYVGMMTLLLVPFAFFGKNRREAVFLAVAGVVAIQIVYGLTPGVWIARHTPLLCGIPNWRLLSVVGFAFAVLSGFGLSALEDTEKDKVGSTIGRRWWISYGITSITTTIGMAFLVLRMATSGRSASHWYDGVGGSALFLLASIVVIGLVLARRLRGPNLRRFALVLLTLDLVTFSYSYVPFVPKDLVFPPAPLFEFLRKRAGTDFRVVSLNATYASNFEIGYGIYSAGGLDIFPRRAKAILGTFTAGGDAAAFEAGKVVNAPSGLLDLLNVKYLVSTTWNQSASLLAQCPERFRHVFSSGSVRVFENLTAMPRVFLIPARSAEVIQDDMVALSRVKNPKFNPRQSVVLSTTFTLPECKKIEKSPKAGEVITFQQGINEVQAEIHAECPSILVVSQNHYPGWKVYVDEMESPLLRADFTFMGVAVCEGMHTVRFVFRPTSVFVGAGVTLAGFLMYVTLCMINIYRDRSAWRRLRK